MTAPTLEAERAAPELLPCPFCSGKAELRKTPNMWMVECNNAECSSNPDALAVFKHDAIAAWNRRTAATVAADVALPPLDVELPPPVWGAVETVGDMVRNLLTLDQSLPIHAAFHVDIEGERRCRTRSVTISRERVIDGKWVDSCRKDVPYAIIVWAKPDERIDGRTTGAAPEGYRFPDSGLE